MKNFSNAYTFEESSFAGCIYGSYAFKEIFEKSLYDNYTSLSFENQNFMCVKNYDVYLTQIYGNYMQLPPLEERIPTHYAKAFLKQ
jgi:lipopolysaccharide cholinephosphotransferase